MAKQVRTAKVEASKQHEGVSASSVTAAAYSRSLVHSDPGALRKAVELARPKPGDMASISRPGQDTWPWRWLPMSRK